MDTEKDLKKRTKKFALRIIRLSSSATTLEPPAWKGMGIRFSEGNSRIHRRSRADGLFSRDTF